MKNILNAKSQILQEAYRLLLTNNLEKVTISNLEKATNKIRGIIFYYFDNKQNLFNSIVEDLFFPSLEFPAEFFELAYEGDYKKFLKAYISPEERVISNINSMYNLENPEFCFYNFFIQANNNYVDFIIKYRSIINKDLLLWNCVIKRAQENLLLTKAYSSEDISKMFMLIYSGKSICNAISFDSKSTCKEITLSICEYFEKKLVDDF